MTRKDFVDMAHSELNDWCIKHNLRGCKEGDCGAEWNAEQKGYIGVLREEYIAGFNAALDENDERHT